MSEDTGEETLSDVLDAAWDAVEDNPDGDGATTERLDAVEKAGEPGPEESTDEPAAEPAAEPQPEPAPAPESAAPIGWGAKAKETWGTLPQEVRQAVAEREHQMAQAMENTSHARRAQAYLHNINNQYGSLLAAEGAKTPMEAIDNMFNVISRLRMSPQPQKAEIIAGMISTYGVDIETLDNVLSGDPQHSQEQQQQQQMEQMIDQKLQPVNQMVQGYNQMGQEHVQEQQRQAHSQVGQFAQKAEFIDHVRNDMADLIDLATSRNQRLDLGAAYQRACAMNPQVQQILRQRQQDSIQQKQAAATSVAGTGHAPKVDNSSASMLDDLNAAWDQHMSG